MPFDINPLADLMARLRDPERGCSWDVAQDFASIAPYTIEEAYEVADAIERRDMAALKDELGDLLLQVVFHSRMAEEAGAFTLNDVIAGIIDKMVRRHPHVFGVRPGSVEPESDGPPGAGPAANGPSDGRRGQWEAIKAAERQGKGDGDGALAGVAQALPALLRAEKLQKRAARTGFDWPDLDGVIAKIHEELTEVAEASDQARQAEEVGDLLFAVVNYARHLNVDAEQALRGANLKFERRFGEMEKRAGDTFAGLPLADKERLWQAAKLKEARTS